jgi:hypothetical protein
VQRIQPRVSELQGRLVSIEKRENGDEYCLVDKADKVKDDAPPNVANNKSLWAASVFYDGDEIIR